MEGILTLIVVSLLAAFCVRSAAGRLRLPVPARAAVIIVFVIVALALFGEHLRN